MAREVSDGDQGTSPIESSQSPLEAQSEQEVTHPHVIQRFQPTGSAQQQLPGIADGRLSLGYGFNQPENVVRQFHIKGLPDLNFSAKTKEDRERVERIRILLTELGYGGKIRGGL